MLFQLLTRFAMIQSAFMKTKNPLRDKKPHPQIPDIFNLGRIYTVGNGTVKLLKPLGFSYTISGDALEEMRFCEDKANFVGNLNRPVTRQRWAPIMGPFKRRILNSTYQVFQYRNVDVELKPNDTINYYLNVSLTTSYITTIRRSFTVLENGTIQHGYVDNITANNPEVYWIRAKLIPDFLKFF